MVLQAEGVELIHGSHEISVIGFVEVLPRVPRIWQVLNDLERAAKERRPAAALLVDVPDFNLRLAKRLKALGIPVVYYVAPMAWAWRESRTKTIAERVDQLLCILPFEQDFFRARGVNATYVGNPVVDQVPPAASPAEFRKALGLAVEGPVFAVLPGSRRSEISRLGPTLAARGLMLVGLDIIGEHLTEINVTSPTCFREIMDQTGTNVAGLFIDAIELACAL